MMATHALHGHIIRKSGKVLNQLYQDILFNHPISLSNDLITGTQSMDWRAQCVRGSGVLCPRDLGQERGVWSLSRSDVKTEQMGLEAGEFLVRAGRSCFLG